MAQKLHTVEPLDNEIYCSTGCDFHVKLLCKVIALSEDREKIAGPMVGYGLGWSLMMRLNFHGTYL